MLCSCGGTIREHELTSEKGATRTAWTCGSCGRYEVIKRLVDQEPNTRHNMVYSNLPRS
jgi:hypothetical protein